MGKTYQSITVNAPADTVWATLRNFHDMSWASSLIQSCEPVGELPADRIGARRLLNGVFHETLRALDDLERTLSYSIDDGPSPVSRRDVSGYVGSLKVYAITEENRSFIEWQSRWEGNDHEASRFCGGIYVGLLEALKKRFG